MVAHAAEGEVRVLACIQRGAEGQGGRVRRGSGLRGASAKACPVGGGGGYPGVQFADGGTARGGDGTGELDRRAGGPTGPKAGWGRLCQSTAERGSRDVASRRGCTRRR